MTTGANDLANEVFERLLDADAPDDLIDAAHETWSALSHACHHHPFDLSPTVSELKPLIDTVRTLIAASW